MRSHRRRSGNPSLGDLKSVVFQSLQAIAGGVFTRSFPQAILKDKNTGVAGYAANLVAAFGGSWAFGKVGGNANMFLVGGIVMTAGRVIEDLVHEKLVEFGQFSLPIPGLSGDSYFDMGMGGEFLNQGFPVPVSSLGPASKAMLALPSPEATAVAPIVARRAGMGNGVWGSGVWN